MSSSVARSQTSGMIPSSSTMRSSVTLPEVADADLDQAVGLQDAQRLTHGHPADAEVLAELALGRQPVARLQLALPHEQADLVDDDPGDAPRVDSVEQPGGCLATRGTTGLGAAGRAPGPLGARGLVQRARATHNGSLLSG